MVFNDRRRLTPCHTTAPLLFALMLPFYNIIISLLLLSLLLLLLLDVQARGLLCCAVGHGEVDIRKKKKKLNEKKTNRTPGLNWFTRVGCTYIISRRRSLVLRERVVVVVYRGDTYITLVYTIILCALQQTHIEGYLSRSFVVSKSLVRLSTPVRQVRGLCAACTRTHLYNVCTLCV